MRAAALAFALALPLHASVIGTSQPAESLTEARVMTLPPAQRGPWLDYLHRSAAQEKADRAALAQEREGMAELPPLPRQSNSARTIPLHREPAFYRSDEARHIGDVILSFQTPAGGWSKNLDMGGAPRAKGQSYATANLAPVSSGSGDVGDFDAPRDPHWHYVGTLDNDATNTELHFLAELSAALPGHEGDAYRASFLRGIDYLLRAQFPNGGWPQVWPLEGGYHDAITFNDDAVTESAELLSMVAAGQPQYPLSDTEKQALAHGRFASGGASISRTEEDYSFVPEETRARAHRAVDLALTCILATQVRRPSASGKGLTLTVWAQQHDPLTLGPVSGRNFEPAALSTGESAQVLNYLMDIQRPSEQVVNAVTAGVAWLRAHQIMGYTWSGGRETPGGRKLTPQIGAGPLWARYYSLSTGKPVFGDRDKTIHDDVMEISAERRNGYAWYMTEPEVLLRYKFWQEAMARACSSIKLDQPKSFSLFCRS